MPDLLSVSNLRKTYGQLVAVDSVSLTVARGEVFGLLGPNGAGKSTTMMMICGLLQPDSGSVVVDGHTFSPDQLQLRKLFGVVPQDLAIYPDLSANENLDFFARMYRVPNSERADRVNDALARVGLTERAGDLVGEYSGGMKRRLNFAAALLHEPLLLILDEPTVGVDPQSRSHLLDSVRQLRDSGIGIIYASHYMEEVESICDRVAIMDHGKILACDQLQDLLGRSSSEVRFVVQGDAAEFSKQLPAWATTSTGDGTTSVIVSRSAERDLEHDLTTITGLIAANSLKLVGLEAEAASLERLFLDLTGHALRD